MLILLISLCACVAILAIIFFIIWKRTDWVKIDKANQKFIDSEGNHLYYDRKIIERKKRP